MRAVVRDAPTSPLRLVEDHADPTVDDATGAEVNDMICVDATEAGLFTETLPLAEAQAAHDRLRSGDVKGRLVLTTG